MRIARTFNQNFSINQMNCKLLLSRCPMSQDQLAAKWWLLRACLTAKGPKGCDRRCEWKDEMEWRALGIEPRTNAFKSGSL